jgi:hypothetical protein
MTVPNHPTELGVVTNCMTYDIREAIKNEE